MARRRAASDENAAMSLLKTAREILGQRHETPENATIIDGGAHHGKFTQQALEVFPKARILAYEPDPDSWRTGSDNLSHARNADVINAALGAKNDRAEFLRGKFSGTNSLLNRPAAKGRPYYPAAATLTGGLQVDVVTIDGECKQRGVSKIDILKLDLQGGELEALHGARDFLSSGAIDLIITEVVFIQKYLNQPLLWKIWEFLGQHGYSLHSLDDVKVGLYHKEKVSPRHSQWNQANAIFLSPKIRKAIDGG